MTSFPRLLSSLLFAASSAFSQDATLPKASLALVNAVPVDANVFISFDGVSIWPPGFTPGQSTAAVFFPAGSKKVTLSCDGYATTEAKLDLSPGANCAIVVYPGPIVNDGADKGKRALALYRLPSHPAGQKPPAGMKWSIVVVGSKDPVEVEINGKTMLLSPNKKADFSARSSGVEVKYKGKAIIGTAPEEVSEYWVVLYPKSEDIGMGAALLDHGVFKVPSGG
jgi:hypothetical protein